MTRKEINKMIEGAEFQRDQALYNLRKILEEDEAKGQEVRWSKLLIVNTALRDYLKELRADDD